jgi:hypothetical protein
MSKQEVEVGDCGMEQNETTPWVLCTNQLNHQWPARNAAGGRRVPTKYARGIEEYLQ